VFIVVVIEYHDFVIIRTMKHEERPNYAITNLLIEWTINCCKSFGW